MPPNVTALVRVQFNQAARLEADYPIVDSGGKANVLIVTSNEVPIAKGMLDGDEAGVREVRRRLQVHDRERADPDWATKIQTEVQSALIRDPGINYVIPFVDGMAQYTAAGITAAGKTDKVKISTFNGTPFALKMIQDGNIVAMDVGENLDWLGWADMDQALRILVGAKPVQSEHTPLRDLRRDERRPGRHAAAGLDRLRQRVRARSTRASGASASCLGDLVGSRQS